MKTNLLDIIQEEIARLESNLSSNKVMLEKLYEKRQEIAALLEAYSKYDLPPGKSDEEIKDIERKISGYTHDFEINHKRLNALYDYKSKLQDPSICSAEESSIEEKYPLMRF